MVKIVMKIHCRGVGTWGDIAPSIFHEIGPNISRSNEGSIPKNSFAPVLFHTFRCPWIMDALQFLPKIFTFQ